MGYCAQLCRAFEGEGGELGKRLIACTYADMIVRCVLLSWGSSLRAVPIPTRMASCIVLILTLQMQKNIIVPLSIALTEMNTKQTNVS